MCDMFVRWADVYNGCPGCVACLSDGQMFIMDVLDVWHVVRWVDVYNGCPGCVACLSDGQMFIMDV